MAIGAEQRGLLLDLLRRERIEVEDDLRMSRNPQTIEPDRVRLRLIDDTVALLEHM